jgi:hypothetical protein
VSLLQVSFEKEGRKVLHFQLFDAVAKIDTYEKQSGKTKKKELEFKIESARKRRRRKEIQD